MMLNSTRQRYGKICIVWLFFVILSRKIIAMCVPGKQYCGGQDYFFSSTTNTPEALLSPSDVSVVVSAKQIGTVKETSTACPR